MMKIACNFQAKVDYLEKLRALGRGKCDQCGIEVDDLLRSEKSWRSAAMSS